VCGSCGRTQKIDAGMTKGLQHSLLASHGFKADFEHFAIYGTCAECARNDSSTES
jgi:Fe2+ or Zn2+ uptake regulation protein